MFCAQLFIWDLVTVDLSSRAAIKRDSTVHLHEALRTVTQLWHVFLMQDVPFDPPKSKGLGDRAMSPMATEGDGSQSNKVPMTPAKVHNLSIVIIICK